MWKLIQPATIINSNISTTVLIENVIIINPCAPSTLLSCISKSYSLLPSPNAFTFFHWQNQIKPTPPAVYVFLVAKKFFFFVCHFFKPHPAGCFGNRVIVGLVTVSCRKCGLHSASCYGYELYRKFGISTCRPRT